MRVLPAEGIAVAVVVNGAVPEGYALELCDLLVRTALNGKAIASIREIPPQFRDRPVTADTSWLGNWTGEIRTESGPIVVTVSFDSAGMMAAVGDAPLRRANASISQGILEAEFPGELPRSIVVGLRHQLRGNLRRNGNRVSGYVTASTQLTGRPFLVLPFFLSLERSR